MYICDHKITNENFACDIMNMEGGKGTKINFGTMFSFEAELYVTQGR